MEDKSILLISMPFADITLPSIQLTLLESYLKNKGISVSSLHLYLFAAETYGLKQYSNLIHAPNDPYVSQLIFTKYVFPNHWKNKKEEIKKFYKNSIKLGMEKKEQLSFKEYEEKTDYFLSNVLNGIEWDSFDLIGFTLNYGQILPSLSVAKKIKENFPEKQIILGGSSTTKNLGKKFLKHFDYIDYIVSGEGENALEKLATKKHEETKINGIISRKHKTTNQIDHNSCVNLNALPFLDFSSFYQQLSMSSSEIQQFFSLNGRLPIELSRGCWWNKCSFCNQKTIHPHYKEKDIDRFIEELWFLSSTNNMLSFQIIGSVLPLKNLTSLCKKIIALERDFQFIAEARSDRLQKNDYYLLKKAGFHIIQTGIESFSPHYIKKMDKGAKVIDNIAALKHSKQYQIKNEYNLITDYPNEEVIDFMESMKTISQFNQYLDPPRISPFIVSFDSPIFENPYKYNISEFIPKEIDALLYPSHFLKNSQLFFYDFKRIKKIENQDWGQLVSTWKNIRKHQKIKAIDSGNIIDDLILYYEDGESFLKIYDKRNLKDVNIYVLDEDERDVFLSCDDIITYDALIQKVHWLSERRIDKILTDLVESTIIYKEENAYLALPLSLRTYLGFSSALKNQEKIQKSFLVQN